MSEISSNREPIHSPAENSSEGERLYFERIFPVIEKAVSQRVRRYNLQGNDAEDVTQNAYFNLWTRARKKLQNLADSELRSYVIVSAQNAVLDFFRRKKNESKFIDSSISDPEQISGTRIEGNSQAEVRSILAIYWNEIRKLSLRQKFVLLLSKDGKILTYLALYQICLMEDVAKELNLSPEQFQKVLSGLPFDNKQLGLSFESLYSIPMTEKQVADNKNKAYEKLKKIENRLNNFE